MASLSKPIPALYTVYILRSTMRHASLYVGSTTDPPRRLKQHNGLVKGGAARTSRESLRPWEMVALVSGFPGAVAALKFEWALAHPHLSLHIRPEQRISISRQRKKNGYPRKPPVNMQSMLANLHLLLRVPSFGRWPLRLHIFSPDVHKVWEKWCDANPAPALDVSTDFGPPKTTAESSPWGIHVLPLDYTPIRDYVDKARDIFTFEREGDCVHCHEAMPPEKGLYAVCPNDACEAVGHVSCWGNHVLSGEEDAVKEGAVVPRQGTCPSCGGKVFWADMMKELTLRLRAPKEVDKLAKAKRKEEKAAQTAAEIKDSEEDDSGEEVVKPKRKYTKRATSKEPEEVKPKRKYTKRASTEPEEVKPKRKYTKRASTEPEEVVKPKRKYTRRATSTDPEVVQKRKYTNRATSKEPEITPKRKYTKRATAETPTKRPRGRPPSPARAAVVKTTTTTKKRATKASPKKTTQKTSASGRSSPEVIVL